MTPDRLAARLLATFLEELDDNVRALNADLLALETNPADAERLRSVFRAMHTLKGAARAAGVSEVEGMCHRAEAFLAEARDTEASLTPGKVTLLFQMVDRLAAIASGMRAEQGGGAAARDTAGNAAPDIEDTAAPPDLRHRAETPSGEIVRAEASWHGGPPPELQSTADSPDDRHHSTTPRGDSTPSATTTSATVLAQTAAPAPAAPVALDAAAPASPQLRIAAARLDSLVAAAGELLDVSASVAERPAELEAHGALTRRWRAEWRRLAARLRTRLDDVEDRTLGTALDAFEAGLATLAADSARIARLIREDARGLASASSRLSDDVRGLRMRPFGEIAEPLPRAARDLAVSLGKPVRLVVVGEDVQADRAVLDAVREALIHLLRNAMDHGLEPADERRRLGKPEQGTITVAAAVVGDGLEVSVSDDGRGVDVAAVRRELLRRGHIPPTDDRGVVAALLRGGLSTRGEATAISGRGVGLDAVRVVAERLGGRLDVEWRAGIGTTLRMRVPVSLATTRVLLARAGGQTFAIPSHLVSRAERRKVDELRRVGRRVVLPAEPEPIPVLSLGELLGAAESSGPQGRREHHEERDPSHLTLAMLALPGRRLALAVDELLDEREVVVRPLELVGPAAQARYAGAVLVRGAGVALVIDPAFVTAAAEREGAGAALAASVEARPDTRRARVLVVDDSLTTRTLEESVLAAAGYDVVTAVDGADGLRVVRQGGIDLVVTDVEMPNMDGLALCEAIRATPATARMPVVLVTSLDKPEQRARGLEAGADAYIAKSSFDQDEFLTTVRQLVGGAP